MQPIAKKYEAAFGSHTIIFETGKLAGQAGGAVTARVGDTMIFASATMGDIREGIDFFPLSIEYEERLYAGGRIPGSFFRREGRPSDEAVLVARLTDRPLRPLFDKNMLNEVQVMIFSLSADKEHPLDILAVNAASAALIISDIPWDGPIGAVRVAYVNGEFIINPTYQQMEESALDLRVAGTKDTILMVECGSDEVKEELIIKGLTLAHEAIQPIVEVQEKMAAEVGKEKREVTLSKLDEEILVQVFEHTRDEINALLEKPHNKKELDEGINYLRQKTIDEMASEDEENKDSVRVAFDAAFQKVVRENIIKHGKRPDGRKTDEIREIWCEVSVSPRVHGSGLFTRGETQVLTLATLGTPKEAQELDSLSPEETKRYMHHYNFPPFSTGEVKRPSRSRREIGHGALAERALVPVLPEEKDFPYTMRLVSEVLSSNGSTSMASVCGSTLALMDTGVPIKAPVAGIAMGLVKEGDKYQVLTDILGLEDHLGDMDFKVAGTTNGVTALQMDIKIKGITPQIMAEAMEQAKKARLFILDKMKETIAEPRPELKSFVPRIATVHIPIEKIGAVIGPGGKTIRSIQEETDTQIDIAEDGTVYIAATTKQNEERARERIQALTESPIIGRIYTGKVVRTTEFGAFVEIMPGTDGLVHISQLDTERTKKVEDIARVGDELTVMITDIDQDGKIRLSRQAVLEGWTAEEAQDHDLANRKSAHSGKHSTGHSHRTSNQKRSYPEKRSRK